MAPRIELFAFRYRDPLTGKWMRARYVATRQEIARRYTEWEITGPAEIRDVDPAARAFTPHTSPLDAALRRYSERPPELGPPIDAAGASCWRYSYAGTSRTAPGAASTLR